MTTDTEATQDPRCIACGHRFEAAEIAGMTALEEGDSLCVLNCGECGADNVLQAEPQQGFDNQPAVTVLRILKDERDVDAVFDESVEPGTRVHPTTAGESN